MDLAGRVSAEGVRAILGGESAGMGGVLRESGVPGAGDLRAPGHG